MIYRTTELELNSDLNIVRHHENELRLTSLTFDLLELLVESAPDVVTFDRLMVTLWKDQIVNDETLTQRVAILRKTLLDIGIKDPVESIRNKGYRWRPEVTQGLIAPSFAKNNRLSPQGNKAVFLTLAGIMLAAFAYYSIYVNKTDQQDFAASAPVSAVILNEYDRNLEQAKQYYNRFDQVGMPIAESLYQRALEIRPGGLQAMIGLSRVHSQIFSKFNGDENLVSKAQRLALKATAQDPENSDAWWALGLAYDVEGKIDSAITAYEKALELKPNSTGIKSDLAYLYSQKGRLVEALKFNIEAFNSTNQFKYLQIAEVFYFAGMHTHAEEWYRRANELSPDNVFASTDRARFLFSHGRFKDAKNIIDAALLVGVKGEGLYLLRALIYMLEGEVHDSYEAMNKAKKIRNYGEQIDVWSFWLDNLNDQPVTTNDRITKILKSPIQQHDIWPDHFVNVAILLMLEQQENQALDMLNHAVSQGYLRADFLMQLPAFKVLSSDARFLKIIFLIRQDAALQKAQILQADWLPEEFLYLTTNN